MPGVVRPIVSVTGVAALRDDEKFAVEAIGASDERQAVGEGRRHITGWNNSPQRKVEEGQPENAIVLSALQRTNTPPVFRFVRPSQYTLHLDNNANDSHYYSYPTAVHVRCALGGDPLSINKIKG